MKLVFCPKCCDVVKMRYSKTYCECKKSWGKYDKDGVHSEIGGSCIPLGFDNSSLVQALRSQPMEGLGSRFEAFVIPKKCDHIKDKRIKK